MGKLIDLLPFLDGWEYCVRDYENQPIEESSTLELAYAEKEHGWFIGANVSLQGAGAENVLLGVKIDDFVINKTISQLNEAGFTSPNPLWVYVDEYNTADDIYSVRLESNPLLPYRTFTRMTIEVPAGVEPAVLTATVSRIRIMQNQLDDFRRSYLKWESNQEIEV